MPIFSPVILGNRLPQNLPEPQKVDNNSWVSVSALNDFTSGIRSNNLLFAWGTNNVYQVGDGTTTNKSLPVQISNSSFTLVSSGFNHSAALTTDNTVLVWGNSPSIQSLTYSQSWTAVNSGGDHFIALRNDGTVWLWGRNNEGQLGDSSTINKSSPVQLGSASNYSQVNAGYYNSAAITNAGELYVWGLGTSGEIGNLTNISRSSPIQVTVAGVSSWTQVSVGRQYCLGIASDNRLFGWGINNLYQLGLDNQFDTRSRSQPTQIGTSSWSLVSASGLGYHSVGIDVLGNMYAWGDFNSVFAPIPTTIYSWTQLSAGSQQTSAIRSDNTLWAWGNNGVGQLGQPNSTIARSSPVQVTSSSFTLVSSKYSHAGAIRADGTLLVWGLNNAGQLGNNSTLNRSSPVTLVSPFDTTSWTQVVTGTSNTAAIRDDGGLFLWGNGAFGQLGDNITITRSSPMQLGLGYVAYDQSANNINVSNVNAVGFTRSNIPFSDTISGEFNGTNYLFLPNPAQLTIGTNDFTIECWVYFNSITTPYTTIFSFNPNNTAGPYPMIYLTTTQWLYWLQLGGVITVNDPPLTGIWYHVAVVRISGSTKLYLNGVQAGSTYTDANNYGIGTNRPTIGTTGVAAGLYNLNGYLSNFRITVGVGVYTGTFTPSTTPLQTTQSAGININAITGTQTAFLLYSAPSIGSIVPLASWSQVDAGNEFFVAKRSDGTLWAWGLGTSGQVGVGTIASRSNISQVVSGSWLTLSTGLDHVLAIRSDNTLWTWGNWQAIGLITEVQSWTTISAGGQNTLAIKSDNTLWAWGANAQGQVGDNTVVAKSSPVNIAASGWTNVFAGNSSSFATNNLSKLFAWGWNSSGQLGDGTSINKSSPVQIGNSSWTQIKGGVDHTLGIDTNGRLFAWGAFSSGQTGLYAPIANNYWLQIAGGIGLKTDNTLWSWGQNVGDNTDVTKSSPVQIGTSDWGQIATVYTSAFAKAAIKTDGTLWMWGLNSSGQLGQNDTINRSSPVQVAGSWSQVSTQSSNTAAISTDGILYTWGNNSAGQLGNATTINRSSPTLLAGAFATSSWTLVSVGYSHMTALRTDRIILAWGLNSSGQLGTNDSVSRSSPTLLASVTTTSFNTVSAGSLHTLAIRLTDSALFGWGSRNNAQVGPVNTNSFQNWSNPTQVGTSSWSQVFAGELSSFGTTIIGNYFVWGRNAEAQLGVNDTQIRSVPTQLGTSTNYIRLGQSSLIDSNFNLFVWGQENSFLFDNTSVAFSSPVQVGQILTIQYYSPQQVGSSSWTTVEAASSFSVAIDTDNLLYGWGLNTSGQLGNQSTVSRSSPVQLNANSWVAVAAEFDHVLAIRDDTTLWTWGNSAAIGLVTLPQSWSQISTGYSHTLAIRSDGALFAWGLNSSGQLAQGDVINRSSPTVIGTNSWTAVSAGNNFSLAIDINNNLYAWGLNTSFQTGDNFNVNKSRPTQIGYTIQDQSTYSNTIRVYGQDIERTIVPFTNSVSAFCASGLTWGIEIPYNSNMAVWYDDDYTMECWIYPLVLAVSGTNSAPLVLSHGLAWSTSTYWAFGVNASGNVYFYYFNGGVVTVSQGGSCSVNTWHHIAMTHTNSTGIIRLYHNGVLVATATKAGSPQSDNRFEINIGSVQGIPFNGYISNVRIAKGVVVYTGDFFPPTTNLTATQSAGYNISAITSGQTSLLALTSPATILGNSWTSVSAGDTHALGTRNDGSLWSWGVNTVGQAGRLTVAQSFTLIDTNGTSLGSGAIRSDGMLFNWGANDQGQLATGDILARSSPVQVGTSSWTSVSTGRNHTLAIRSDGTLWAWGLGTSGQLGVNNTANSGSPVQVTAISESWASVSAGVTHSVGITTTGNLYAWGSNTNGILGIGVTTPRSTPVQITTIAESWSTVSAGYSHTAGITTTGTIYVWGLNTNGQLGNNTVIARSNPTLLASPFDVSSWTIVSAGLDFTMARLSNAAAYGWGINSNGQLGNNTTINRSNPTLVSTIAGISWTTISAGAAFTTAISTDSTLWSWGQNNVGQLGNNTIINRSTPTQIGTPILTDLSVNNLPITLSSTLYVSNAVIPFSNAVSALFLGAETLNTVGGIESVFGTGDFTIEIWVYLRSLAANQIIYDQRPSGTNGAYPTIYFRLSGTAIVYYSDSADLIVSSSVSANTWYHVAVTRTGTSTRLYLNGTQTGVTSSDSRSYLNGANRPLLGADGTNPATVRLNGYLSNLRVVKGVAVYTGTFTPPTSPLTATQSSGVNISAITAGQTTLLLLTDSNSATLNNSWSQIGAGQSHVVAKQTDGTLWTWGLNTSGQMGYNDAVNRSSPVLVGNIPDMNRWSPVQVASSSWSQVSAGTSFSSGIDSIGQLYAWGLNASRQLGDTTTINKFSPIVIASGSWTKVSSGASHSLAIRSDAALFGWGAGPALAINNITPFSWSQIAQGTNSSHNVAIRSDGSLWAWGLNTSGQLGDNTVVNKSSPTLIDSGSWTQVSIGLNTTFGIKQGGGLWAWGNNASGNFGDSSVISRSSPTLIDSNSWSTIAAGQSFTAGIKNYQLFTWGNNAAGVLGNSNTINRSSPSQIGTRSWSSVSAGQSHILATDEFGTLYAWGQNSFYQLGDNTTINKSSPVQISSGGKLYSVISAGFDHNLAIDTTGKLWTWGRQTSVNFDIQSWIQVSQGVSHTLALRSDGVLFTWGLNTSGELGLGDIINRSSPVIVSSRSYYTQISAGNALSAAIDINNNLQLWGINTSGVQGEGFSAAQDSSTNVPTKLKVTPCGFTDASSYNHTVIVFNAGGPSFGASPWNWIWGDNNAGHSLPFPGTTSALSGDNNVSYPNTLTIASSTPLTLSSSTWTIEFWIYVPSFPGISTGNQSFHIMGQTRSGDFWAFSGQNSSLGGFYRWWNGSTEINIGYATTGWDHVAAVNDGSIITFYLNGVSTNTSTIRGAAANSIILYGNPSSAFTIPARFYISNVRIVKGIAVYTSAFSVPKANLTSTQSANVNGSPSAAISGTETGLLMLTTPSTVTYTNQSFSQVSAGSNFNILAITTEGRLVGVGRNAGQFGDGTTIDRSFATQIGSSSWSQVSAGLGFTVAKDINNNLFTWGTNAANQLGDATTIARSNPIQIGGFNATSWNVISAGWSHAAAIDNNGKLFVWGAANNVLYTTRTFSWIHLTASSEGHIMGLRDDYTLWAWGVNTAGQLGDNSTINKSSPVVVGANSRWNNVSVGASHTLAIANDGTLYAWGFNNAGQLGDNTVVNKSSPILVSSSSFTLISGGTNHSAAITGDNKLFVVGNNTAGQLGTGTIVGRSNLVQITGSWSTVSTGNSFTVAINSDSLLFTWGTNVSGVLGIGNTLNRSSPVQVGSTSWLTATAGTSHILGITITNELFAWGNNASGQLGQNNIINRSSPVSVGASFWSEVAAGDSSSAAIRSDGLLFTWGRNATGQLGLGNTINRSSPVVVGTSSWIHVTVGQATATGIDINYLGYVWGAGTTGQIGTLSAVNRSSPVLVNAFPNVTTNYSIPTPINDSSYVAVSAAQSTTTAIRSDNTLWAWGLNTSGQLGNNTIITRSSPVQIGSSNWTYISSGSQNAAINQVNNRLFVWGINNAGQLGQNNTLNRSSPVLVDTGSNTFAIPSGVATYQSFSQIAAGNSYSLALRANDNVLMGWGLNNTGQLGDTTLTSSSRSNATLIGITTFKDNSVNNLPVSSIVGGPKAVDFSPFANRPYNTVTYGGSIEFNGATSVTYPYSTVYDIGSNDASVEVWAYFNSFITATAYTTLFGQNSGATSTIRIQAFLTSGVSSIRYSVNDDVPRGVTPIVINTWYHLLVTIDSNTVRFFINGQLVDYAPNLGPVITKTDTYVFGNEDTGYFNGFMSNFRLSNGSVPSAYQTILKAGILDVSSFDNRVDNPTSYVTYGTSVIPFASAVFGYFLGNATRTGYNSYLSLPNNSQYQFGTGDFTIEFWIRKDTAYQAGTIMALDTASAGNWAIIMSAGSLFFQSAYKGSSLGTGISINTYLPINTWVHVAVVRISGSSNVYIDGVSRTSFADTQDYTGTGNLVIGSAPAAVTYGTLEGYLSNIRIVKGVGVYTANFTVPSSPLQTTQSAGTNINAITGTETSLLLFNDTSSVISSVSAFTPPTSPLTTTSQGATAADIALLCFQSLPTAYSGSVETNGFTSAFINSSGELYNTGLGTTGQMGDGAALTRSNLTQLGNPDTFTGPNTYIISPTLVASGSWSNVSAGVSVSSAVRSDNTLWVWGLNTSGQLGNNIVANRNTPKQNFDVIDESSYNQTIYNVGTNYSTSVIPFAGTISGRFNGINNYLFLGSPAQLTFGTSDFTIELFVYLENYTFAGGNIALIDWRSANGAFPAILAGPTGLLYYVNTATRITGPVLLTNTWHHIAVVKQSGNTKMYLNGVQVGSTWVDATNYSIGTNRIIVGTDGVTSPGSINNVIGYISNIRVVSGVAVYTGEFTVPTSSLTATQNAGVNISAITAGQTVFLTYATSASVTNYSYTQTSAQNTIHGIASDGSLYGTGINTSGAIGIASAVNRSNFVQVGASGQTINTYTTSPVQVTPGTSGYAQVWAGQSFSATRRTNGDVFAWGLGTSGQLGLGDLISRSSPVLMASYQSFNQVLSVGYSHWAQVRATDWIPLDVSTFSNTVTKVATTTKYNTSIVPFATAVSIQFNGTSDYFAVTNNTQYDMSTDSFTVECWYYDNGSTVLYPNIISSTDWTSGGIGLRYNNTGQANKFSVHWNGVGDPFLTTAATYATATWHHVALVRSGNNFTLYVNGSSAVTGTNSGSINWGYNTGGPKIGGGNWDGANSYLRGYISNLRMVKGVAVYTGTFTVPTSPLEATQSADTNISAITGTETSLLLFTTEAASISWAADNKMYTQGGNGSGQLGLQGGGNRTSFVLVGNGTHINSGTLSPVQVGFGIPNSWTSVNAGTSYSYAKNSLGQTYVWGINTNAVLGLGDTINRSSPVLLGSSVTLSDTSQYNNGIVVSGTPTYSSVFIPVPNAVSAFLNSATVYTMSADFSINSTLNPSGQYEFWIYPITAGEVMRFGVDGLLQSMVLNVTASTISSFGITGPESGTSIGAGATIPGLNVWTHVALVFATDRIYINGVLGGTGNIEGYTLPAQGRNTGRLRIGGGFTGYFSNFRISNTTIYTGNFTVPTIPLLTSGGAGTNINAFTSPNIGFLILTDSNSISGNFEPNVISTGQSHVAVTYVDNTLYTFGLNSSGQLGDNTIINRFNPTLVGNYFNTNTISPILAASASWSQASAGTSYSLAINADGTLWAWGLNNVGQLGQSDITNRSSIVQIGSGPIPFLDSSGTIASISVNGSPFMIGTISPYAISPYDLATYGGSGSFPGTSTGNYINIPDSVAGTNLQMGTGDFTIELWTYNTKSTNILFGKYTTALGSLGIRAAVFSVDPTGYLQVTTTNYTANTGNYINLNTWHHIAIVRDSGTIYAYIDGIQRLTMNGSDNLNQTYDFVIGNWVVGGSSVSFRGYISDFRVVKGTAVYITDFTPPTEPLPVVSGTTLLTLNYIDTTLTYSSVRAGHSTSVATKANNILVAWGLGTSGQLGTNTVVNRSVPLQVGIGSWTTVTTGNITSAGIDEFGLLYVWGGGSVGQFGSSLITNRSNPTLVQGINYETKSPTIIPSYWESISAGFSHTAGISSQALYTWGLNSSGQLGLGDTINRSSPSLVGNPPTITDSSSNNYTAISPSAGGQPIISTFGPFVSAPSAFFNNTAASVFYYTNATNLQFGTGAFTIECFVNLTSVSAVIKNIINKGVGTGGATGFTIRVSGDSLEFRIAGAGYSYPTPLLASIWYHIAVTRDSSNDVRIFVNGISSGVLVNSTYDFNQTSDLRIGYPRTGGGYNDLMRGYLSNIRLVKGTALYTANFTPPTTALTAVSGTQLLILTTISSSAYSSTYAGTAATFALRTDNNLFATGNNAGGEISGYLNVINRSNLTQIGNNYISVNPSSPVQIAADSWSIVSAGTSISAAIRSDGLLFTWGSLANSGQLGDGTIVAKSSPVQIGNSSWTQVSVYDTHMIGLTIIGSAYTWGLNASGQLGITLINPNGDVISRSSPTLVGADFSIIDVSGQNNIISKVGTNISTTIVPVAGAVSLYFNGIVDYLRADTALDVFTVNTDEFTIEGYVYPTAYASPYNFFIGINGAASGSNQLVFGPNSVAYDGESSSTVLSTLFPLNTWSHFAASFDGTTARFFNNGQIVRTVASAPSTLSACVLLFGCEADAGDAGSLDNFFKGYLSNLRIVKQCLYTGSFTPPSGILTDSSVGTSGANVAASLTGTVSLLTLTTQAATITGQGATYFNSIAAGASFTGGVTTDGSLFMWGLGTTGQLGYGTAANRSSPVQVGTSSWTSVYAGSLTASALRKDSILFNWGAANTGQLGQIWASTVNRSSPVSVGNEYAGQATNYTRIPFKVNNQLWKAVNASNSFTSALTSNDRLFVWGLNNTGQLGLNDTINRSEPNQIGVNTYLSTNGGTSNMGAIGKAT